jgi:hypothetical protein
MPTPEQDTKAITGTNGADLEDLEFSGDWA